MIVCCRMSSATAVLPDSDDFWGQDIGQQGIDRISNTIHRRGRLLTNRLARVFHGSAHRLHPTGSSALAAAARLWEALHPVLGSRQGGRLRKLVRSAYGGVEGCQQRLCICLTLRRESAVGQHEP